MPQVCRAADLCSGPLWWPLPAVLLIHLTACVVADGAPPTVPRLDRRADSRLGGVVGWCAVQERVGARKGPGLGRWFAGWHRGVCWGHRDRTAVSQSPSQC